MTKYVGFGRLKEVEREVRAREEAEVAVPAPSMLTESTVLAEHAPPASESTGIAPSMPAKSPVRGYTKIPNAVLDELLQTLSAPEQLVYLRLFRLSHGFDRDTCSVGYITLGKATNQGRATVMRAVDRLVHRRLVERVDEGGGKVANTYRVLAPGIPAVSIPRASMPAKSTVPAATPMKRKEIKETVDSAPVAPAPDLSIWDIRKIAARLVEANKGRDYPRENLLADVRTALIGEGREVDEGVIAEALR